MSNITFADKRFFILKLLESHTCLDAHEEESRKKTIEFVQENIECFENNFKPGHVNGAALITNYSFTHVLLTHHKTLNRWFQLGGHSDGDPNTMNVALREAHEESGLSSLVFIENNIGIFDIDVHPIPEKGEMPLHYHYDIRFLMMADMNEKYDVTEESHDLQWVSLEDAKKYNSEHAFVRMIEKVKNLKKILTGKN